MSALIDRITEVLRDQQCIRCKNYHAPGEWCGGSTTNSGLTHVAERIAADIEPQYVWVVHYDNYGDRWLHGIYDSEDKVEEFRPKDPGQPWKSDYEIEMVRVR